MRFPLTGILVFAAGRRRVGAGELVAVGWGVGADGGVGDVAFAAFDAVVDADLADGAEGFVVEGGDAEGGAEFFVELPEIVKVRGEGGEFLAVVGEQEFLVAGVPELGELAVEHDGGQYGHLKAGVGFLAEFGAAAVFFNANNAAGGADAEAQGGEAFDGFLVKAFVNIPHGSSE